MTDVFTYPFKNLKQSKFYCAAIAGAAIIKCAAINIEKRSFFRANICLTFNVVC